MTERLAVYGTLLSAHGAQDHLDIRERMEFVVKCDIEGLLYDLGGYPGLVAGPGVVKGELYEVDSATLRVVDFFEQFDPDLPHTAMFRRRRRMLLSPREKAWVYLFEGDTAAGRFIETGDFGGERSAW